MKTYTAKTGEQFTDADVERWADEAESGFKGYSFKRVDPRTFELEDQRMRAHSVRIEDSLWASITARAKAENMKTSELVRRALANYLVAS